VAVQYVAKGHVDPWIAAIASYSITSSALANSDVGIVRPSAFATVTLMINSCLVGSRNGMSLGFAPFEDKIDVAGGQTAQVR
jgi:hypothetical protein